MPEGFHLKAGDANPPILDGSSLTIQSGKHAIIDWEKFSIDHHETVRFLQEGPHASILNRVTGGTESAIYGLLESNGRVYLINPDGLIIGPNARIETTGFIASSLDVLDSDFLNGEELLFSGEGKGAVINQGIIRCPSGDVLLIAREVRNEGEIEASQGLVSMAAGKEVLFKPSGSERIFIRPEQSIKADLEHTGSIRALAVELKAGGGPYASAVKSSGRIDAYGLKEEGGRVYLFADGGSTEVNGTIIANDERGFGGRIQVLGEEVFIKENALLDVSGDFGGGTILMGGDHQGKNPEIPNAAHIFTSEGAQIKADSRISGNAGTIISWGTDTNQFQGHISAQALGNTGDGGFAEISATSFTVSDHPDLRSLNGRYGEILFDAGPVLIQSGLNVFIDNNTFNDGYIIAQLGLSDFSISTTGAMGGGQETITINDDITIGWADNTKFTLTAGANIHFANTMLGTGAVIAATGSGGAGSVSIELNGNGAQAGFNYNGIWMEKKTALSSTVGHIHLSGIGGDTAGAQANVGISMDDTSTITSTTGNMQLTGNGGSQLAGLYGILLNNTSEISSTTGSITLTGTGGTDVGTGGHVGVQLINSSKVFSTGGMGANPIQITGTGGDGMAGCIGVTLLINSEATSSFANISINGNGNGTSSNCQGIVLGDTLVHSDNGDITLVGNTSLVGDTSAGVAFTGINSQVTNADGDISITGQSFGNGTDSDGIFLSL